MRRVDVERLAAFSAAALQWWLRIMWVVAAVIAVAMLVVALSGCAELQQSVRRTASLVVSGLPRGDLPALRQAGIIPAGSQTLSVDNGSTPFYGRIYIYGEPMAELDPGDRLITWRSFEPLWAQIPAVEIFYTDPGMTQCVGAAARVFQFPVGYAVTDTWPITVGEIRGLDGRYVQSGLGVVYPPPATQLATTIKERPRESYNGTAAVPVVNVSLFTVTASITVGNKVGDERVLPPCGFTYWNPRVLLGPSQTGILNARFTDPRGGLAGQAAFMFTVPEEGVLAYPFLLGPWDIRR